MSSHASGTRNGGITVLGAGRALEYTHIHIAGGSGRGTAFYDNANLSESEEDVDIFFLTTCSAFLSRPLTKCARYRNAMIQRRSLRH